MGVITWRLVTGLGRAVYMYAFNWRGQNSYVHMYIIILRSQLTISVLVCVTVRLPVRYGEKKLVVHLYSPASSRLSGLNVRVRLREYTLSSLSQRRVLELTASCSSPITSHINMKLCPSIDCPLVVMEADNAGAVCNYKYITIASALKTPTHSSQWWSQVRCS